MCIIERIYIYNSCIARYSLSLSLYLSLSLSLLDVGNRNFSSRARGSLRVRWLLWARQSPGRHYFLRERVWFCRGERATPIERDVAVMGEKWVRFLRWLADSHFCNGIHLCAGISNASEWFDDVRSVLTRVCKGHFRYSESIGTMENEGFSDNRLWAFFWDVRVLNEAILKNTFLGIYSIVFIYLFIY